MYWKGPEINIRIKYHTQSPDLFLPKTDLCNTLWEAIKPKTSIVVSQIIKTLPNTNSTPQKNTKF